MIIFEILLATDPSKPLIEAATQSQNLIPLWGALITTAGVAVVNWFSARNKKKVDQFQIFMDESSEFREEMRKERKRLQEEVTLLEGEKTSLKKQVGDYTIQLESCLTKVKKSETDLVETQKNLEIAHEKLGFLKEQVIKDDKK
jgi:chromosome segregation ATPase